MPSTKLITSDDLEELANDSRSWEDPSSAAGRLVAVVDEARLADPTDAGYALAIAAELLTQAEDLPAALNLVERGIEANREHEVDDDSARALRAELLVRLGRHDEGMSAFEALRPRLADDPDAAEYLTNALREVDRLELAHTWLTAALEAAVARVRTFNSFADDPEPERALVAASLAAERHELRRELDLPHDELDDLADRMEAVLDEDEDYDEDYDYEDEDYDEDDEYDEGPPVVAFWPRPELERLLSRWPALAATYGPTWDEYRTRLARDLVTLAEASPRGIVLSKASFDGLIEYLDERALDIGEQVDEGVVGSYADFLDLQGLTEPWPPGRNEPCWCGSGQKYKKCCLPRSRTT